MSVETMIGRHVVYKKIMGEKSKAEAPAAEKTSLFAYPECGGHAGSSSHNWVPADFIGYQIARVLHVTNEDIKKKKSH